MENEPNNMGLFDLYTKAKKKIGDTVSSLGATARGYANSLKDTLNAPAPKVLQNTIGRLPDARDVFKPAYDVLSSINTRPLSSRASSPLGKLAGGIVETPYTFLTSVPKTYGQTMKEINSKSIFTPGGVKRTAGRVLESGLDTASMGLLGKGARLAKAGAKSVADSVVLRQAPKVGALIREGAKSGLKVGAGYGGAYGGAEALKEEKNAWDTAKDVTMGAGTGALMGGALGGGLPAVGALAKAAKHDIALGRRAPKTETIPTHRTFEDVSKTTLYPAERNAGMKTFKPSLIPEQSFKESPVLGTTARQIGEALPRPGMSIEDVSRNSLSKKNSAERAKIRADEVKNRPVAVQANRVSYEDFIKSANAFKDKTVSKTLPLVPNKNTQQANALNAEKNARAAEAVAKMPRGKVIDTKRIIPDEVFNTEAGSGVFDELSAAKAGERQWVKTPDEIGTMGHMIGIPSTFPRWVPEDLRRTKLFEEVKNALLDATLPKSKPARRLYDIVHNEIRSRSKLPLYDFEKYDARKAALPPVTPKPTPLPKTSARRGNDMESDPLASFTKSLDEIPTPWGEKAEAKLATELGTMEPAGGYNKYQQRAYNEKGNRVRSIGEVLNAPETLRAMGYKKAEALKLGAREAETVAQLGKLGYPKDHFLVRDPYSEQTKRVIELGIPYERLKSYYDRKRALNTNILEGIDPETLRDISPLQAGTRDVYRNFETVFGGGKYNDPTFQKVKRELLDPFDASKGNFIEEQQQFLKDLDENIVKGLGIKKGSRLSAAVQMYGEGKLNLEQIKAKFPKDWERIVKADQWFRKMYDEMLDETNRVREYYFPTHPLYPESTKIIPKRANYYRHFQEMADGFQGLKNIFDTPANIDPSLAVSSEFTKPGNKWLSFAQRRKGERTTNDAVGGFLDYIRANAYAKHIDPHIQRFRGVDKEADRLFPKNDQIGLAEELSNKIDPIRQIAESDDISTIKKILTKGGASEKQSEWMGKELAGMKEYEGVKAFLKEKLASKFGNFEPEAAAENSGNRLNNFLKFLDNFANDLSGKTNPLDRPIQDNFLGRHVFRAINWVNSRVKANVILGNLGSALAQPFSIPSGIANAGVRNALPAVSDSLAGIFAKNAPSKKSTFLAERYFRGYDAFDPGIINNTKRLAIWMTSVGDKIGTTFTWNAQYRKALSEGVKDPIKYADDWTRRLVAGRGVGEVPIVQKAKITQLIAPFQLEVSNQWRVFGDWARNNPSKLEVAKKLMEYSVAVWVMNRVVKELRGSDVAFDPIQAMAEAIESYQDADSAGEGALLAGGRLAGETFSNLPLGAVLATHYPEFGKTVFGKKLPTREKFFGDKDPTRFGGGLLAGKALLEPQYMLLPPFGGRQVKQMYEGVKTLARGYSEDESGNVTTPVERTPYNIAKGLLFGKNSLQEVQDYRESDRRPLSEEQSFLFKKSGGTPYYDSVMERRDKERAQGKIIEERKKAVRDMMEDQPDGETPEFGAPKQPQQKTSALPGVSIASAASGEIAQKAEENLEMLPDGTYFVKDVGKYGTFFDTKEDARFGSAKALLERATDTDFVDMGDYILKKEKKAGPGVSITALTPEEGKIEMIKSEFKKSKESYFDDGETVYLKAKNGDVTTKPKNEFTLDLNDKRMNFAKDTKDFVTWRKHAEESFSLLNTMLENPALNELDYITLSDKKETLARDLAKFLSYGGAFTKPKKGRKLEEKYRYPLIDKDMMKVQSLLSGGVSSNRKPMIARRPLSLIPVRLPKVRRYRRRRK